MKAADVIAEEDKYHAQWISSGEAKAGMFGNVKLVNFSRKGSSDFHYNETHRKNLVVLHYTQGWIWGDLPTLTTSHLHVSVPFVVARSGRIYRLFPEDRWSYHLGRAKDVTGSVETLTKRSIAIEISNVGQLELDGDDLKFAGRTYCKTSETQYYQKLASPYRGYRYFASFTDAQYAAVDALIGQITTSHGIARKFLDPDKRYAVFTSDKAADDHKGIASHVNYRRTGKTDIGPAFDWARIGG